MKYDTVIEEISRYAAEDKSFSRESLHTALLVLKDSMGCMIKSLDNQQCLKMLGPVESEEYQKNGIPVPGNKGRLSLLDASWNIGLLIRWLDYNDCFLAEEWGHPSDNLGGILSSAYYRSAAGNKVTVSDVLTSMIKAHEIQGVLSLSNSLNRQGYDHVFFVKLATAAVTSKLLGGNQETVRNTVSNVFADGAALRLYRHAPHVTTRKSWAAGDATMRGVRIALLTDKINEGYPNVLSEPGWGFNQTVMQGNDINLSRDLNEYVINNILFKAGFPAEFHAQTAAEAAMLLNRDYSARLNDIRKIKISTHESAIRIIAHKPILKNPSDRDHSLEYITAVSLLNGRLETEFYSDDYHKEHPEIDNLIGKMQVVENKQYSVDYLDPDKRSISNAVQLIFNDGSSSEVVEVEYPAGHKFRRSEVGPILDRKFENNLLSRFDSRRVAAIQNIFDEEHALLNMDICDFMHAFQ